jgi:peroxiredoxin Q/BCP
MLAVGDTAPDFSLPDSDGRTVTLANLLTNGPLILFFYPADFTPVCTREVCLFRDAYSDLVDRGIAVAGVSPNDTESHARFRDQFRIDYVLLADPNKQAIAAYRVLGPLGILRRTTYLIEPNGRIQGAVRADLRLSPHNKLISQALNSVRDRSGPLE